MFKLAAVGATLALALTGCAATTHASAHPVSNDKLFAQYIDAASYDSLRGAEREAIGAAHSFCHLADVAGFTYAVSTDQQQADAAGLTQTDVDAIIGGAVKYYCHQYADQYIAWKGNP